jgi:arginyl-tRNA synthetase
MFDHKHHQTLIQQIKEILRKTIINYTDVIDTYRIDINKINIDVNRTKDLKFGDYASSVVLSLNLVLDESLRIANLIATNLPKKIFKKVTVVPPGFINMELNQECNARIIGQIIKEQNNFGQFRPQKLFYNIEFVSANPTGLLHVGHARNAAIGDSLCRI